MRYRDTWYLGSGGLLFLFTEPDRRRRSVGVLLAASAVLSFFLARNENRKRAGTPPPAPEPYAHLQAEMARLHQAEDEAAHRSPPLTRRSR